MPELKQLFPNAPYVARPGNINAWDNEDFVRVVKAYRNLITSYSTKGPARRLEEPAPA